MIIFLHGTDDFRIERQSKKIIEKFILERDPQRLNTNTVHGKDCTLETYVGMCLALPFLAEKRLTYISHFFDAPVSVQEKFLSQIKESSLPDFSIFVIQSDKPPKTKLGKELFAELAKGQFVYEYNHLTGKELEQYLDSLFEEQGRKIKPIARTYLATNCLNLWSAFGVISQVIDYSNAEEISLSDIKTFLPPVFSETIFTIIDTIVSSHPRPVFSLLDRFYQQGNDPGFVLAMLIRQYKLLLQMTDIYEREGIMQSQTLAKRLGQKPFIITKLLPIMKKTSVRDLEKMYQELLSMDIGQKTSTGDLSFAIDMFVARSQLQSRR